MTALSQLTFAEPDFDTFTLLPLAFYAAREDGVIPAVLNASDEVAVKYFLDGKIGFSDVFDIVERTVKEYNNISNPTLNDIINADKEARIITLEHINKMIYSFSYHNARKK